MKAKKAYQLKKSKDISKDLENSLLGPEAPPSKTPASTSTAFSSAASVSTDKSSSSDPLLFILEKMDNKQGRLSDLEKGSTSVSSNEVNMTTPVKEGSDRRRTSSHSVFAITEEEDTEDYRESRTKRACSLSPSSDEPSTGKDEEVDDAPSYRQVLASVRNLLDLPTSDEFSEDPSKIFVSKDRRKKTPILPLSLPPVEKINNRWTEMEKKVAGNPSENGERLLSAPYNTDTFLPYTRPLMKFYQLKQLVSFVREPGWVTKHEKIGINTNSKIRLPRVQIRLKQGRSLTHRKELAYFDNSHRRSKQFDNNSQNPDVVYRHPGISGKDSPNGQVTHEAFPVVPENSLEISPIIGQKDSMFRDFEKASDLVETPKKCVDRLSSLCRGTQSPVVYRCICQGIGCTIGKPDSQWHVVRHRGKFAYKHSGIENSVSSNKVLSDTSSEQEGPGGHRQCHSSVLPQQARGDPLLRNVSNDLAPDGIKETSGQFY